MYLLILVEGNSVSGKVIFKMSFLCASHYCNNASVKTDFVLGIYKRSYIYIYMYIYPRLGVRN